KNEIVPRNPAFFDVNNDGWDELFVFSNNDDSLYLSIVDVHQAKFLQKEKPLLASSPQRRGRRWDLHSVNAEFAQLEKNGPVRMLFAVNTGYARLPRCLCLYDLDQQKIINRFDYNLSAVNFAVTDLNKDGFKEIALGSAATNNFPSDVSLSDAFSWFVLLDHKLNYLKPPIKIGGKFTGVQVKKIENSKQNYLVVWEKDKFTTQCWIIDSTFQVAAKRAFNLPATSLILPNDNSSTKIVIGFNNGTVNVLNTQLELLTKKEFKEVGNNFVVRKSRNIVGDDSPEYFCYSHDYLYLYDNQWQLLAYHEFPSEFNILDVYFVARPQKSQSIVCTDKNQFFTLQLFANNLYGKIPFLFIGLLIVSFFILISGYWTFEKIRQYVFAFFFLLRESDNAIILL
ncbi:MAG: hypothetical protein D6707_09940, partial [Bacteroidetes bacterium]